MAGPDWKGETPAGDQEGLLSTTQFALALFRTQLFNPEDMPNVEKVQAGYKVAAALRVPAKQPAAGAAPKIDFLPATTAGIKDNFFEYLDSALQFRARARGEQGDPGEAGDASASVPARPSISRTSPLEHKAAVLLGMKEGDDKVDKFLARTGRRTSTAGTSASLFGDRAFFNGDWLMRAAAAKGGIYGNDAVEAMYPLHEGGRRTASRSTAASTTTRSPSRLASCRR